MKFTAFKDIEFSLKPATEHRVINAPWSFIAFKDKHPYEIGEALIGVQIVPGYKTPHLHGIGQPDIFKIYYVYVSIREEKYLDKFVRNIQVVQGMYQLKYRARGKKRYAGYDNGVRFYGNQQCIVNALYSGLKPE